MENFPVTNENNEGGKKERLVAIALELVEKAEVYEFLGLKQQSLDSLRAVDEEFPGYTTPTDEIIERMKNEGIKISMGDNPNSVNVFILPAGSNNVRMDGILPRHFDIIDGMDEKLKELILISRE